GTTVKAMQGSNTVRTTTTDASGNYSMQLVAGDYTIQASKTNYGTSSADVTVTAGNTTTQNFALDTARGEVSPTSLDVTLQSGATATRTLTLSNTGSLPMAWTLRESGSQLAKLLDRRGAKLHRVHLSKANRATPGFAGSN